MSDAERHICLGCISVIPGHSVYFNYILPGAHFIEGHNDTMYGNNSRAVFNDCNCPDLMAVQRNSDDGFHFRYFFTSELSYHFNSMYCFSVPMLLHCCYFLQSFVTDRATFWESKAYL